jgi:hypothetical protein
MPHFGKLVEAYEHAGCSNWFINLSPPSKILGEEMRLPTGPGSNAKKEMKLGVKIGRNERHFRHRDWELPLNIGVAKLSSTEADKNHRQVHKFPAKISKSQSNHFSAHGVYKTAPHSIVATEGWVAGPTGRGISGPYGHEVRAGSSSSGDASWQISVVSTMSTAKHAKLAEYIQQHMKKWDLDFKVVMPGKAGKQLFEEYPLSDQSVLARAHGREGGEVPNTGKAAKGVKRAPNKGGSAKGVPNTGGSAKGVPNTGKAAKGAAHWNAGVMQTPQQLLLAFQQDISSRSC